MIYCYGAHATPSNSSWAKDLLGADPTGTAVLLKVARCFLAVVYAE